MAADASLMPELHAEVHTVKGEISVHYQRDLATNTIKMNVVVPANAEAIVSFEPLSASKKCVSIKENNNLIFSADNSMFATQLLSKVNGVNSVSQDKEDGTMHVSVGSGSYSFSAKWL